MDEQTVGIAAVIGFFLPLIISVIQQTEWKPGAQAVVAFLVCVVAAIVGSYFTGEIKLSDPSWDWITWFGAIWATAMVSYKALWKPTNVSPKIEETTNLKG